MGNTTWREAPVHRKRHHTMTIETSLRRRDRQVARSVAAREDLAAAAAASAAVRIIGRASAASASGCRRDAQLRVARCGNCIGDAGRHLNRVPVGVGRIGGPKSDSARGDAGSRTGDGLQQGRAVAVVNFADNGAVRAPGHLQPIPMVGLPVLADGGDIRESIAAVVLQDELARATATPTNELSPDSR